MAGMWRFNCRRVSHGQPDWSSPTGPHISASPRELCLLCESTQTLPRQTAWIVSLSAVGECTCIAAQSCRSSCWGASHFCSCAARPLAAGAAPAAAGLRRARLAGAAIAALPSAVVCPHASWTAAAVSIALH